MALNQNAQRLGITDDEVADLQDAIERAKAASEVINGIKLSGIDCGEQGELCQRSNRS
jgi:hypothetical protein